MSNPHVPLDPDPLNPSDVGRAYAAGFEDGWESTKPKTTYRAGLIALLVAALSGAVIGALLTVAIVHAAPRSAQATDRVDLSPASSPELSGAPLEDSRAPSWTADTDGQASSGETPLEAPAEEVHPSPATSPDVEIGTAIASGIIAYAEPSFGDRYLAIPEGPGHRVRICSSGGCLVRTSTDAGPDLAMQRDGRIADVSYVDFAELCGCRPEIAGLIKGSIEHLGPGVTPPATDR